MATNHGLIEGSKEYGVELVGGEGEGGCWLRFNFGFRDGELNF